MSDARIKSTDLISQSRAALARWDNEGGAGPEGRQMQDMTSLVAESRCWPARPDLEPPPAEPGTVPEHNPILPQADLCRHGSANHAP